MQEADIYASYLEWTINSKRPFSKKLREKEAKELINLIKLLWLVMQIHNPAYKQCVYHDHRWYLASVQMNGNLN